MISFSDGRDILTQYGGDARLQRALETGEARALALASADFDEDGVPDLVGSYSNAGAGIVTLNRGNADSIYPYAPEARQRALQGASMESPFLSEAVTSAIPAAADFLGAGDFDGDGHWDVVGAARSGRSLYLLRGDGRGGFQQVENISLRGEVTALVVGEMNRRDGLDDVVVATRGEGRPRYVGVVRLLAKHEIRLQVLALGTHCTGIQSDWRHGHRARRRW